MSSITTGSRWVSSVCDTEVIVVRAPSTDVELTCGGVVVEPVTGSTHARSGTPAEDAAAGTLLGKRYVREDIGLEVLCTKAGAGSLAADGDALVLKTAAPLPSSD